jgi:hypothetical protein
MLFTLLLSIYLSPVTCPERAHAHVGLRGPSAFPLPEEGPPVAIHLSTDAHARFAAAFFRKAAVQRTDRLLRRAAVLCRSGQTAAARLYLLFLLSRTA